MYEDAEFAWAAGFLDGEGHFGAKRTNRRSLTIVITAAQVSREPLDKLRNLFGGNIYWRNDKIWFWSLGRSELIIDCIDAILPWLTVKRDQAKILRKIALLIGTVRSPRKIEIRTPIYAQMIDLKEQLSIARKETARAC